MSDISVPHPKNKVVNFDHIKTFDQALDYAMGGFHASETNSTKDGETGKRWKDAAMAYYAAYLAIEPLKALPGDQALAKALELLKDANHKADIASGKAH